VPEANPPELVVVGLGPADGRWLPPAAADAATRSTLLVLRTERHPAAAELAAQARARGVRVRSLDQHYETAGTLEEAYRAMVEDLVAEAARQPTCYAVPGSPLVAEATVRALRVDPRVRLQLVAAPSFLDLAWAALGVDPLEAGVRLVDAGDFAVEAAGQPGPFLVGQCDQPELLSAVKLAVAEWCELAGVEPPDGVLLHHLGLPDQLVVSVPWPELDRSVEPDHLTSLYVPRLAPTVSSEAARLEELVRELRTRCPWDREQTHGSLAPHLLEEAYEALEAVEAVARLLAEDPAEDHPDLPAAVDHLEEELGDLVFQVALHSRLAAERGWFTWADVLRRVHDKLVRRHPHVFGSETASSAEEVAAGWERRKLTEEGRSDPFAGIPSALPALAQAAKVLRRAAALPEAWASPHGGPGSAPGPDAPGPSGAEPARAADLAGAVGEALLSLVALAGQLGVDPEAALRAATARFRHQVERSR
jgi:tetrapyrrole methylase family protein/MazG family protein